MITTMLYSKGSAFNHMYKSSLSKIKGMGIFYTLVSFILFPLQYFLTMMNGYYNDTLEKMIYNFLGSPKIYTGSSIFLFLPFMLLMAVIMPIILNSYMHNKNAVDTYHALPIKRSDMLKANLLATLTWLVVPLTIWYVFISFGNFITQQTPLWLIWLDYLKQVSILFSIQAIAAFVSVSTCGAFDAGLFTIGINGVVPAIALLIELSCTTMLLGYSEIFSNIERSICFSPMALSFSSSAYNFGDTGYTRTLIACAIWVVVSFVLIGASGKIYKKRNSEYAQSFDTSGIIYRLLIAAATFFCGVLFALAITELFFSSDTTIYNIVFVIFSAIGGSITFFAFEAVLSRSFKINSKRFKTLIFSLIFPIVFSVGMLTGGFGYEQYIPKMDKIKSATINYVGEYVDVKFTDEVSIINDDFQTNEYNIRINDTIKDNHENNITGISHYDSTFKDQDGINIVTQIHTNTIKDSTSNVLSSNRRYIHTVIKYTLNSGRTVNREYRLEYSEETSKLFKQMNDNKEFIFQHNPIVVASADQVSGYIFTDSFGGGSTYPVLDKEKTEKLYTAMGRDILAQSINEKINVDGILLGTIEVKYNTVNVKDYTGAIRQKEPYSNVYFQINTGCKNTIAALNEIGLGDLIKSKSDTITTAIISYSPANYDGFDYNRSPVLFSSYQNYSNTNSIFFDSKHYDNTTVYQTLDKSEIEYLMKNVKYAIDQNDAYCIVAFTSMDTDTLAFRETKNAYYYLPMDKVPANLAPIFQEYARYKGYSYSGEYLGDNVDYTDVTLEEFIPETVVYQKWIAMDN